MAVLHSAYQTVASIKVNLNFEKHIYYQNYWISIKKTIIQLLRGVNGLELTAGSQSPRVRNFARDEEPILGGFIRDAYYCGEGERLKKRVALLDGERA
jgi:hypothetical protein